MADLSDVVIYHRKTKKIEAVIGKDLTDRRAEKIWFIGLSRINGDYNCDMVDANKYKEGDILTD